MRILMIGWGFPPRIQGGLDTHVSEVCRELAKRNEVYLTLPEFNSPGEIRHGIKIIPIKCPGFSDMKSLVTSVKEYNKNVVEACRSLDFDVAHAHDWFGVEAAERLGKPWVFTLHSFEYMRSGQSRKSAMERLERRGVSRCNRIITVSKLMKRDISEKYGIGQEKIDVVYNSASAGRMEPERIRKKLKLGKGPVVLFLGRLSGQKGPEYFLHSAKLVLEKIPEAKFIVAGEGDLRRSLELFSSHLGLDGKVIFPGFIPETDIASYYSAADVYALPSLHEPFGITILESLLCETPVVVSRNAGALEKMPAMGCVQKVRPADPQQLARKIVHLLGNHVKVSQRDKEAILKAYSWEKAAKETLKVYRKVKRE